MLPNHKTPYMNSTGPSFVISSAGYIGHIYSVSIHVPKKRISIPEYFKEICNTKSH